MAMIERLANDDSITDIDSDSGTAGHKHLELLAPTVMSPG